MKQKVNNKTARLPQSAVNNNKTMFLLFIVSLGAKSLSSMGALAAPPSLSLHSPELSPEPPLEYFGFAALPSANSVVVRCSCCERAAKYDLASQPRAAASSVAGTAAVP